MRIPLRGQAGFTLVELLVTIMILGIVMSGITSVVVTSMRTEQYQSQLQDVVDDGRLSLTRIRPELRSARRVLESSDGQSLHFWVDQNQNSLPDDPEELICYAVEPLDPDDSSPTQWQISRWTHALEPEDCEPGAALPAGASRRVVATTLVSPDPSDPTVEPSPFSYSPPPAGIADPPTREVTITLDLEVASVRGPKTMQVEGSIRLRNVP